MEVGFATSVFSKGGRGFIYKKKKNNLSATKSYKH